MKTTILLLLAVALWVVTAPAQMPGLNLDAASSMRTSANLPAGKPDAMIDLGSVDGVKTVKGEWRYSDTKIVEADFRGPGPDKQPTGAPVKTYDYTPHAGGANFDDSKWEAISPTTLDQRRG